MDRRGLTEEEGKQLIKLLKKADLIVADKDGGESKVNKIAFYKDKIYIFIENKIKEWFEKEFEGISEC